MRLVCLKKNILNQYYWLLWSGIYQNGHLGYYENEMYKDEIPCVLIFELFSILVMPHITVQGLGPNWTIVKFKLGWRNP